MGEVSFSTEKQTVVLSTIPGNCGGGGGGRRASWMHVVGCCSIGKGSV